MDSNMDVEGQTGDRYSSVELELYFLIAKFLSSGPCKKASEALQSELEEYKLLPKRVDWEGGKHFRSFDSLNESLSHISSTHLLQICQRIGPILDRELPPNVKGVSSLLGAGRQSLLRTKQAVEKTIWTGPAHAVRRHGRPLMPPHNMIPSPNVLNLVHGYNISGGLNGKHMRSNSLYSKLAQMTRALGHLSAVYCVAFDRTGQFIITGADDHLIKIWSATTGRLLATLRGHAAEITDMAINYENTMLATGSCDKQIRVWCLRTASPIAVLHAHTGMITSLQFSPMVRKDTRYLMSTGGDGCVCFWQWNVNTQKFNPKPIKFIERSRAGAQMLCSSFSPGGIFLATGSADQVIRVYCFSGVFPEKICELEAHTDQVDSIQYANNCDKFVSGSKDGTARLWRYERQTWKAILLNMGQQMSSDSSRNGPVDDKRKYTVTMIEWTKDDMYIITAVNDNTLKVWDSNTGYLVNILKAHQDEVYVLENNPVDPRILLSAGHDGHIMFWDLPRGVPIFDNFNNISGQGHGAVFDCKWAPNGLSFATTDSHGFVRMFGLGSNEKFKVLPEEYFFHTDYRPLIRDQNGYVLDEQTQQSPHLMPPPFLVDIDGNPHPPHLQRLVPGRQNCTQNQLIPQIGITPSGDREVMDDSIADQNSNREPQQEATVRNADEEVAALDQPRAHPESDHEVIAGPSSSAAGPVRPSQDLDSLIARMQRDMDVRLARGSVDDASFSSPPREPEQQAEGAVRVISVVPGPRRSSEGAGASDKYKGLRSIVVPLEQSVVRQGEEQRLALADAELKYYQAERKKRPPVFRHDSTDSGSTGGQRHTRQQRRRPASRRSRQARNEETGRNRLTTRALYDTDVEEDDLGEEDIRAERARTERQQSPDDDEEEEEADVNSENEEEEEAALDSDDQMWHSDNKSDSDSSDYSDWTPVGKRNMAPPKRRSQRQIKRKRFASYTDEEEEDSDDTEEGEEDDDDEKNEEDEKAENEEEEKTNEQGQGTRRTQPKREQPKKKQQRPPPKKRKERRVVRNRPRSHQVIGNTANVGEVPDEYKPPDWLTETVPHKAPYYPQIGDEIMYFRQGHENYVRMCKHRKAYDINPKKNQPWHKTELREQELVKVVGIKYEIKPPRLVCLKLAMIDPVTSKPTGASFSVKYHDMPDVIDFLVLRQTYNTAVQRKWKVGDRFRSIIDNAWWCGTITSQEPYQGEYPDSLFQCYNVQWDNKETEKMSPWDFEPLLPENEPEEIGASVPVQTDEIKDVLYLPQEGEWPDHGMGTECERIIKGLEQVIELSVAENFSAPVDLNAYPDYAMVIEYPIDLSTIKARLENRFYRRTAAVMYDVRLIEGNTKKFNLPGSRITKSGTLITELLLRFIRDTDAVDVMPMYSELAKDSDFAVSHAAGTQDEEAPGTSRGRARSLSGPMNGTRRSSVAWDPNSWKEECLNLTQDLLDSEDSVPFRQPVDPIEVPDYFEVVETPMDLTTIMSKVEGDIYSAPNEFAEDVRLIFSNSKAYNTNKRSRIYTMTLRLSAKFEEKMNDILEMWKKAKRYGKSAPNARRKSSARLSVDVSEGASNRGGTSRSIPAGSSAASSASATSPPGQSSQTGASSSIRRRVGSNTVMTLNSRSRDAAIDAPAAAAGASSSRSSPPTITRSGRAVKRKKIESDSDETEIDSDAAESRKRGPPVKKTNATSQVNGHGSKSRYSTRNKTGATKRKRYQSDDSFDDETEEETPPAKGKGRGKRSKRYENDDSIDDETEEETPPAKGKGRGKRGVSNRRVNTRSSPRKVRNGCNYKEDEDEDTESDSDTETENSEEEESDKVRNHRSTRGRRGPIRNSRNKGIKKRVSSDDESTAESTSESNTSDESESDGDEEDEESEYSDSDGSVGKSKRTTRKRAKNQVQRRTSQRPKKSPVLLDEYVRTQRSRRNTRNQGRRTVRYDENSDEEAQLMKEAEEDSEATDDYSDPENITASVSSRGRVRKMTAKAKASLMNVS